MAATQPSLDPIPEGTYVVDKRIVDLTFWAAGMAYVASLLALGILPMIAGGTVANRHNGWGQFFDYIQLFSITVPPLIVLFGLYRAREDMRDAIAGAAITAFIVILGEAVILGIGDAQVTSDGQVAQVVSSLRATAVTNFMALVGSISLFYFGSEAVIRYGDARAREADSNAKAAKSNAVQAQAEAATAALTPAAAPAAPAGEPKSD
jgi:hypothetical protein